MKTLLGFVLAMALGSVLTSILVSHPPAQPPPVAPPQPPPPPAAVLQLTSTTSSRVWILYDEDVWRYAEDWVRPLLFALSVSREIVPFACRSEECRPEGVRVGDLLLAVQRPFAFELFPGNPRWLLNTEDPSFVPLRAVEALKLGAGVLTTTLGSVAYIKR